MTSSSAKTKAKVAAVKKKQAAKTAPTKGALLPSVRVEKELREQLEEVITGSETMASFIEASVRSEIHDRQARQAFLDRGLRSKEEAERTGVYYGRDEALGQIDGILATAKAKAGRG